MGAIDMDKDALADKLNSIEVLIGAEMTPPPDVDKLGWHLDSIRDAIEGGGSGGGDVSKEYVDAQLEKKVDKITSTSANPQLYGVSEEGAQTTYFATQTLNANTIPLRDASGRFQVADGVAPKQAVNKEQLDALGTAIDEKLANTAQLNEQNTFTALNTFAEEAQFNKGLASDANISVTNAIFKIMNNSDNGDGTQKDYVAQYDANKISLEENGSSFTLSFPKKSGTLATTDDIASGRVPFKYSEFITEDVLGSKEDGWKLTDNDASINLYHENTVSQTGLTISKNHVGIQATEDVEDNKTNAGVIALSSDTISMYVNGADGASSTSLLIDKDKAQLNGVNIATATDLEGKLNVLAESVVNQVYAKTQNGNEGISYTYSAEGGTIAQRSAAGTLAVEDPTQEQDAANKKYVDKACAAIPSGVEITNVPGATSGLVAEDDFLKLTSNPNEYIIKEGKKYDRSSDRSTEDSYTYVYNGYLNNRELQEAIEITVSSKSWVLNADKLLTDRTIANGKIGGVSIKNDFSDGLEVSQTDGNLSIYGALDADIAGRASKRPVTPTNLNRAVLAALTDTERVIPNEDQQAAFKAAWGFTESQIDISDLVDLDTEQTITNAKIFSIPESVEKPALTVQMNTGDTSIPAISISNTAVEGRKLELSELGLLAYTGENSYIQYSGVNIIKLEEGVMKGAYNFPDKMGTIALVEDLSQVVELSPDTAQNGTLTDEQFNVLQNDSTARIKLNNEYYILMDEGHTSGILSYIHTGWNGETDQTKSINITVATKAWTLKVGEHNYYHHYIYLTVDTDKFIYYDFPSTQESKYTAATLPAQPDVSATTFTLLYNGRYASISGQIYRNAAGDLKAILHGIYTTDGTTFAYLSLDGVNVTFNSDTVQKID